MTSLEWWYTPIISLDNSEFQNSLAYRKSLYLLTLKTHSKSKRNKPTPKINNNNNKPKLESMRK